MTTSSPPNVPKKGMSKALIAAIIVAIVAIAAVAGAYIMLSDDEGTSEQNANDNGNDNTGTDGGQTTELGLVDGDYMKLSMTTEQDMMTLTTTISWVVSNVTSDGYDVTITVFSDSYNYTDTIHANLTDELGSGVIGDDDNYSMGTLIGTESISTPIGTKQVEHWRVTEADDNGTTVIDYYVGKDTKMIYKWVVTETKLDEPGNSYTTTTILTETNIEAIRNGDRA